MIYRLIEEYRKSETGEEYTAYGLEAGGLQISDISCKKEVVEQLRKELNESRTDLSHFEECAEEFIAELTTVV